MKPWLVVAIALAACSHGSARGGSDAGPATTPGGCTSDVQCGSGQRCLLDDPDPSCGVAPTHLCFRDDECPAGSICGPSGYCGGTACVPRCTGCRPQDACNDAGHCAVRVCTGDDECPANFACTKAGPDFRECRVKGCSSDEECRGACVNGHCSATRGRCGTIVGQRP